MTEKKYFCRTEHANKMETFNKEMKRILIFSHYHPYDELTDHVLFSLSQLRQYYKRVIFVSNSILSDEVIQSAGRYTDLVICRENKGFDFGAWKDVILSEGWNSIRTYDSLTLMNDTCFGPLFSMDEVFEKMEKPGIDFWGLTNHGSIRSNILHLRNEMPEHIQSYFLVFNNNVLQSPIFEKFWVKLKYYSSINDTIKNCEIRLTKLFESSGFSWLTYINTSKLSYSNPNMATMHADIMVNKRVPMVKVKGFLYSKNPFYLMGLIERSSQYDTKLIRQHFQLTFSPNDLLRVMNKSIIVGREINKMNKSVLSVAIHIHVFYVDVLKRFLEVLNHDFSAISLFITTDTAEKGSGILNEIKQSERNFTSIDVIVVENRGRNVWAWLSLAEKLKNFDVVGHFHTKQSRFTDEWFGLSWFEEILLAMVKPAGEIISQFEENANIGIIIPDIPYGIKMMAGFDGWAGNKSQFNDIWNRMSPGRTLDASMLNTPIMPYGCMFWYRPKALLPLFDLRLSADDFPTEPIPIDGTLAHAIERLPVYLSWSQGYDFRIACHTDTMSTGFEYIESSFKFMKETLYSSYSWRIGKMITWFPRAIKGAINRLN